MSEKTTTRVLLIVVLVSFFAFALAHDMDHAGLGLETTSDHQETIPHVEGICALTVIGAVMGFLGLRRARDRHVSIAASPRATSSLVVPRASEPPRCSGFQLAFPMLA